MKRIRKLTPFLEEAGSVASTIGSPQVAATRGAEAAIVPSVVAGSSAPDARSSGNINQRRTSEKEQNLCDQKKRGNRKRGDVFVLHYKKRIFYVGKKKTSLVELTQ